MKRKLLIIVASFIVLICSFSIFIPTDNINKDSSLGISNLALDEDLDKAGYFNVNTKTENQPFLENAGNSQLFRIPAFIELQDGSLFAAADARYTTLGDGGGLDSIVAKSEDNGKTWTQSYAIRYPDSQGFADLISTTCIDPAVVQGSDGTIYLIADMNPTGVTTKPEYIMPNVDTGYMEIEGVQRLALTDNYEKVNDNPKSEKYPYYVGDYENGFAKVLNASNNSDTQWVVDEWLNIYEKASEGKLTELTQKQVDSDKLVQQNAFYQDSKLHLYNTGYLMIVESKDNGKTWTPNIINTQIKRENEKALLVSPGKGTIAKDNTIIIPFYSFEKGEKGYIQKASFIWSKDQGKTWNRTKDVENANKIEFSSESEIVEVHNGTLRMFIRNNTNRIAYVDANWNESENNYVWSEPVVTNVKVWSNCNLTAITLKETIDNKMAVMVACPSGKKRTKGKIITFLVEEDNSMKPVYGYKVNNKDYAYSCMDQLKDGTIGLLYEGKPGTMTYVNYSVDELIKKDINFDRNLIISLSIVVGIVLITIIGIIVSKLYKNQNKKSN